MYVCMYVATDIDECDSDPCAEYASCYNNNGSFYCACNSGFTGDGITYCRGEYILCVHMSQEKRIHTHSS